MTQEESRSITEYKPFSILNEFDRTFDAFRKSFNDILLGEPMTLKKLNRIRFPVTDIRDLGDKYMIEAEIPGIQKKNISLQVDDNYLEITGKEESEKKEETEDFIRRERGVKSFYRKIALPSDAMADEINAKLEDGILSVELPKSEKTSKKTVEVQ